MKASWVKLLCAFLVSAFFLAACKTYDNDSNVVRQMPVEKNQNAKIESIGENQSQAQDDAEELAKHVKIPYEAEEALWKVDPAAANENSGRSAPGPTDTKLIAVLKFKPADTQKLLKQAETYKPAAEASLNVENWYPPELIAKSQESGDETIKGMTYAPNDFAQSPYLNGSLTHITGTDYFVLELLAN